MGTGDAPFASHSLLFQLANFRLLRFVMAILALDRAPFVRVNHGRPVADVKCILANAPFWGALGLSARTPECCEAGADGKTSNEAEGSEVTRGN
jgi:hypothetical protein